MTITTIRGTEYVTSHNIEAVSRYGQIDKKSVEKFISVGRGFGRFLGSVSTPFIDDDDTPTTMNNDNQLSR